MGFGAIIFYVKNENIFIILWRKSNSQTQCHSFKQK